MHRLAALALTLLLAGFLAACGDDDSDTSNPADTAAGSSTADDTADGPADDTASDDPADEGDDTPPASTGDAGTATVDGATYGFDRALRCDPDSVGVPGLEREIEAQFLGDGVQLDVYVESINGMPMHQVSWAGPEGIFGASFTQIGDSWMGEGDDIYQDSPVVVDGDRATGSVVLYDAMTMEDTIELDFDVTIPSETFACR